MAENQGSNIKYASFEYMGTVYTMEFNRKTATILERNFGVNIAKTLAGDVNITDLPVVFQVSLMMHHPKMKQETAIELFDLMGDRQGLLKVLAELLANTVMTMFEEPEEGKAISWTQH